MLRRLFRARGTRGSRAGLSASPFPPDFRPKGLWYSVHLENAAGNPARPDFVPPGYGPSDATFHNVVTEWHATDPRASTFAGTRRELLRIAHAVQVPRHPPRADA